MNTSMFPSRTLTRMGSVRKMSQAKTEAVRNFSKRLTQCETSVVSTIYQPCKSVEKIIETRKQHTIRSSPYEHKIPT